MPLTKNQRELEYLNEKISENICDYIDNNNQF